MIGILGYYNRASRGDDLLQVAMQRLFEDTCAFTVSSPSSPAPIPLDEVNALDALVVGGGTLLGLALPYPLCDPTWVEGVTVPLYVFGAGAKFLHRNGALLEEGRLLFNTEAHCVLKAKARYFGVRGPLTQAGLKREGVASDVLGDSLLAIDLNEPTASYHPLPWLVNFRHPAWFGRSAYYEEAAREIVRVLKQEVSLFPLAFDGDDARFLSTLFGEEVEMPPVSDIINMVQGCAGVIAMRLHACVLAAVCGKPYINLGYELKSWDFQMTVSSIEPISMVPEPPDPQAVIRQWEQFQGHDARFGIAHFRKKIIRKANAILEEMIG